MEAINNGLKFARVADHEFRQKAVFTGHTICFDNLRRAVEHLCQSYGFTGHGVHSHISRSAEVEGAGIDHNSVALDRARILQLEKMTIPRHNASTVSF